MLFSEILITLPVNFYYAADSAKGFPQYSDISRHYLDGSCADLSFVSFSMFTEGYTTD